MKETKRNKSAIAILTLIVILVVAIMAVSVSANENIDKKEKNIPGVSSGESGLERGITPYGTDTRLDIKNGPYKVDVGNNKYTVKNASDGSLLATVNVGSGDSLTFFSSIYTYDTPASYSGQIEIVLRNDATNHDPIHFDNLGKGNATDGGIRYFDNNFIIIKSDTSVPSGVSARLSFDGESYVQPDTHAPNYRETYPFVNIDKSSAVITGDTFIHDPRYSSRVPVIGTFTGMGKLEVRDMDIRTKHSGIIDINKMQNFDLTSIGVYGKGNGTIINVNDITIDNVNFSGDRFHYNNASIGVLSNNAKTTINSINIKNSDFNFKLGENSATYANGAGLLFNTDNEIHIPVLNIDNVTSFAETTKEVTGMSQNRFFTFLDCNVHNYANNEDQDYGELNITNCNLTHKNLEGRYSFGDESFRSSFEVSNISNTVMNFDGPTRFLSIKDIDSGVLNLDNVTLNSNSVERNLQFTTLNSKNSTFVLAAEGGYSHYDASFGGGMISSVLYDLRWNINFGENNTLKYNNLFDGYLTRMIDDPSQGHAIVTFTDQNAEVELPNVFPGEKVEFFAMVDGQKVPYTYVELEVKKDGTPLVGKEVIYKSTFNGGKSPIKISKTNDSGKAGVMYPKNETVEIGIEHDGVVQFQKFDTPSVDNFKFEFNMVEPKVTGTLPDTYVGAMNYKGTPNMTVVSASSTVEIESVSNAPEGIIATTDKKVGGVAKAEGTYTFPAKINTVDGNRRFITTDNVTLNVRKGIEINSPMGSVANKAFDKTIEATGGLNGPYTFGFISGSLPPGFSLSGNRITGTSTKLGTYKSIISVTDGTGLMTHKELIIDIMPPVELEVTKLKSYLIDDDIPRNKWEFGEGLIHAKNGVKPYTFSLTKPIPNVSITKNGVLKYQFDRAGEHKVSITVTDSTGDTDVKEFSINAITKLRILTKEMPKHFFDGHDYSSKVEVEGGEAPYKFTIVSLSDYSMSIDDNGIFTSKARDGGWHYFRVMVKDESGQTAFGDIKYYAEHANPTDPSFDYKGEKDGNKDGNTGSNKPAIEVKDVDYSKDKVVINTENGNIIRSDVFNEAIAKNKDVIIKGKGYEYTFKAKDMKKIDNDMLMNFEVIVGNVKDDENISKILNSKSGKTIRFMYNGKFPGLAEIKVHVGKELAGQTFDYLYLNPTTNKLEFMYKVTVDKDGNVMLKQDHASMYVMTNNAKGGSNYNPKTGGGKIASITTVMTGLSATASAIIYKKKKKLI